MKKLLITLALFLGLFNAVNINAFDLKDLLGGGNTGNLLGNVVEGILSSSNITINDMVGEWTSTGSAVNFADDNLLKKAGGIAAAAAVQSKLDPYFNQLGLNGAVVTINPDSTFSLKTKLITLNGTISQTSPGNFIFKFKAFNTISIGEINAHAQKTSSTMDLLFDARKLVSLLSSVSKLVNISSLNTITNLLGSYDGLYIGFKLNKTKEIENPNNPGSPNSLDKLKSIFGSGSNGNEPTNNNNNNTNNSNNNNNSNSNNSSSSKVTDLLKGILNKK